MATASKQDAPAILQALVGAMKDVGSISKNQRNDQQRYMFRGIDDVYKAVQPALIANGIIVSPTVRDITREERATKSGGVLINTSCTVDFCFHAAFDGSSITVTTVGEAMDSGDKSTNKAMSAAYKYALFQTLCIPTEGGCIDSEKDTHEVAAAKPKPSRKPKTKAEAPDATQEKPDYKEFLEHMATARKYVGDITYYAACKAYGREHANEFRGADEMAAIIDDLRKLARAKKGGAV